MDLFLKSLDLFFLLVTLAMIPAAHWIKPHFGPHRAPRPSPISPFLNVRSAHSTPTGTPLASPKPSAHLEVPQIRIVPERPRGHKRKSVSFSLSSMDELHHGTVTSVEHKKRPPTPYVVGPSSPGKVTEEPEESGDSLEGGIPNGAATPLAHSKNAIDPMGVAKKWLLP